MTYLKQFMILCLCLFIGSILKAIIPLPIPETIYGMLILFLLFVFKKLKPNDIRITADAILDNMAILFLPAGVGIIENMEILRSNFVALILITTISAFVGMVVVMVLIKFLNGRKADV